MIDSRTVHWSIENAPSPNDMPVEFSSIVDVRLLVCVNLTRLVVIEWVQIAHCPMRAPEFYTWPSICAWKRGWITNIVISPALFSHVFDALMEANLGLNGRKLFPGHLTCTVCVSRPRGRTRIIRGDGSGRRCNVRVQEELNHRIFLLQLAVSQYESFLSPASCRRLYAVDMLCKVRISVTNFSHELWSRIVVTNRDREFWS